MLHTKGVQKNKKHKVRTSDNPSQTEAEFHDAPLSQNIVTVDRSTPTGEGYTDTLALFPCVRSLQIKLFEYEELLKERSDTITRLREELANLHFKFLTMERREEFVPNSDSATSLEVCRERDARASKLLLDTELQLLTSRLQAAEEREQRTALQLSSLEEEHSKCDKIVSVLGHARKLQDEQSASIRQLERHLQMTLEEMEAYKLRLKVLTSTEMRGVVETMETDSVVIQGLQEKVEALEAELNSYMKLKETLAECLKNNSRLASEVQEQSSELNESSKKITVLQAENCSLVVQTANTAEAIQQKNSEMCHLNGTLQEAGFQHKRTTYSAECSLWKTAEQGHHCLEREEILREFHAGHRLLESVLLKEQKGYNLDLYKQLSLRDARLSSLVHHTKSMSQEIEALRAAEIKREEYENELNERTDIYIKMIRGGLEISTSELTSSTRRILERLEIEQLCMKSSETWMAMLVTEATEWGALEQQMNKTAIAALVIEASKLREDINNAKKNEEQDPVTISRFLDEEARARSQFVWSQGEVWECLAVAASAAKQYVTAPPPRPSKDPSPAKSPTTLSTSSASTKRLRELDRIDTPSKKMKSVKYSIALSGFRGNDPNPLYSIHAKEEFTRLITTLGGTVSNVPGDTFCTETTHVIAPPQSRTIKMIAAALTGAWVLPAEWLKKCQEKCFFVPEYPFGFQGDASLLRGLKAYCCESLDEEKRKQVAMIMCEYGGGSLVTNEAEADFVFIQYHKEKDEHTQRGCKVFLFEEFIHFIFDSARSKFEVSKTPRTPRVE